MGTRVLAVLVLLWGVWGSSISFAADWSLVPSINARTEYNSNLNFDYTNPLRDFIFTLSPAAEFNYATETSKLQGRLGLTGLKYIKNPGYDHIDQNYVINGQHSLSPRWQLSLTSSFIVDSTQQQELLTSGLVMNRTPRMSFMVGPGVTYNLTERLAATANYSFNKVNYSDPQYQNYLTQQAGLTLSYQLKNQKTVLSGTVSGQETSYASINNTSRMLTPSLGVTHKFSDRWQASIAAGMNISYIDSQTQVANTPQGSFITVPQARIQQTTVSPYFNLSATRRWTNLTITGGYLRNQTSSAFAGTSEVNQAFLNLSYNFTERLSGSLTGSYNLSNQLAQQNNLENDNFSISPKATYLITEKLSISPGYRFGQQDDITNSRSAHVHNVWLMLSYSYPIHYQK
jgi:hypothetical protein